MGTTPTTAKKCIELLPHLQQTAPRPLRLQHVGKSMKGEFHYKWIPTEAEIKQFPTAAKQSEYDVYVTAGPTPQWRLEEVGQSFGPLKLFEPQVIYPKGRILYGTCEEGICYKVLMVQEGVRLLFPKPFDPANPPSIASLFFENPLCAEEL